MIERLLRRWIPHKELGWPEVGEEFTRFQLIKTPWFNLYIHRLKAETDPGRCHDHPWHFWTFIVSGGYWEETWHGWTWRGAGSLLFRWAKYSHNTVTKGVMWSIVLTSGRVRKWGFLSCDD
jgi:hypothetical protein